MIFNDVEELPDGRYFNVARLLGRRTVSSVRRTARCTACRSASTCRCRSSSSSCGRSRRRSASSRRRQRRRRSRCPAAGSASASATRSFMPGSFGEEVARLGANLLVTISNDSWYGRAGAQEQHFAGAVLRAVETQRYLLRAAITGISGIVDEKGRIVGELPRDTLRHPARHGAPRIGRHLVDALGLLAAAARRCLRGAPCYSSASPASPAGAGDTTPHDRTRRPHLRPPGRLGAAGLRSGAIFDVDAARRALDGLREKSAAPDFWSRPAEAQELLRQSRAEEKTLETRSARVASIREELETFAELLEEGESAEADAREALRPPGPSRRSSSSPSRCPRPRTRANAWVMIHAGAGGTESQDWAEMLLRMYLRFVESRGWKGELIDRQDGEEAGSRARRSTSSATTPTATSRARWACTGSSASRRSTRRSAATRPSPRSTSRRRSTRTSRSRSPTRTCAWTRTARAAPAASTST